MKRGGFVYYVDDWWKNKVGYYFTWNLEKLQTPEELLQLTEYLTKLQVDFLWMSGLQVSKEDPEKLLISDADGHWAALDPAVFQRLVETLQQYHLRVIVDLRGEDSVQDAWFIAPRSMDFRFTALNSREQLNVPDLVLQNKIMKAISIWSLIPADAYVLALDSWKENDLKIESDHQAKVIKAMSLTDILAEQEGPERLSPILSFKCALNAWQRNPHSLASEEFFVYGDIDQELEEKFISQIKPEFFEISAKAIATLMLLIKGVPVINEGQEMGISFIERLGVKTVEEPAYEEVRISRRNGELSYSAQRAEEDLSNERFNTKTACQFYRKLSEPAEAFSIFEYYRELLATRKKYPELLAGDFLLHLKNHPQVFVFERVTKERRLLVAINLSNERALFNFPKSVMRKEWRELISNKTWMGDPVNRPQNYDPFETRVFV